MKVTYRIKNWNENYENNRTREWKSMQWVPIPIKLDGSGYSTLIEHKNGAAHFGIWLAILEVAAKCEERGTLTRGAGMPHDATSLSRVTRIPQKLISEAISRLLSPDIGWLEVSPDPQQGASNTQVSRTQDAGKPQEGAPRARGRSGIERNRKEWNGEESQPSPSLVDPWEEFQQWFRGPIEGDAWRTYSAFVSTPARLEAMRANGPLWMQEKRYSDGYFSARNFLKSEVWLKPPKRVAELLLAEKKSQERMSAPTSGGYSFETFKKSFPTCDWSFDQWMDRGMPQEFKK